MLKSSRMRFRGAEFGIEDPGSVSDCQKWWVEGNGQVIREVMLFTHGNDNKDQILRECRPSKTGRIISHLAALACEVVWSDGARGERSTGWRQKVDGCSRRRWRWQMRRVVNILEHGQILGSTYRRVAFRIMVTPAADSTSTMPTRYILEELDSQKLKAIIVVLTFRKHFHPVFIDLSKSAVTSAGKSEAAGDRIVVDRRRPERKPLKSFQTPLALSSCLDIPRRRHCAIIVHNALTTLVFLKTVEKDSICPPMSLHSAEDPMTIVFLIQATLAREASVRQTQLLWMWCRWVGSHELGKNQKNIWKHHKSTSN
ncbi:hypothetical protein SISSUDRAFT_1038401 [Sistotremastrum suecicum HHB10207 ss-3]|uniref:Uncharacterized protein n=1 Tax=Sistotremastrum suecicum HHB10207 ss-3 TaxID=1314776 RepID=A0A165WSW1_9AGAM|nr:hypothetical protein SISSUDRAFT_1038401 [Sistotremastrum suecicum HHB10207 ss-3]